MENCSKFLLEDPLGSIYKIIYSGINTIHNSYERDECISKYFKIECQNGNTDGIKYLLSTYDINYESIEKGFQQACIYGNLPIIKLIESYSTLYHHNFSWYLASSTRYAENIETTMYLFSVGEKLGLNIDIDLVLLKSCKYGNFSVVEYILNNYNKNLGETNGRLSNDFNYPEISFRNAYRYPKIFDKLIHKFPDTYKNLPSFITLKYFIFRSTGGLIDNKLKSIFEPADLNHVISLFSFGTLQMIKYFFNNKDLIDNIKTKWTSSHININTLLGFMVINNKSVNFKEFIEYFLLKFPDEPVDFQVICEEVCLKENTEAIDYLLKNFGDKIDINNIVAYILLHGPSISSDMILKYLLHNKYISYEDLEIYNDDLLGSLGQFDKQLTYDLVDNLQIVRSVLSCSFYMLKYSHKKNIIKEILYRDIYGYLCKF